MGVYNGGILDFPIEFFWSVDQHWDRIVIAVTGWNLIVATLMS